MKFFEFVLRESTSTLIISMLIPIEVNGKFVCLNYLVNLDRYTSYPGYSEKSSIFSGPTYSYKSILKTYPEFKPDKFFSLLFEEMETW